MKIHNVKTHCMETHMHAHAGTHIHDNDIWNDMWTPPPARKYMSSHLKMRGAGVFACLQIKAASINMIIKNTSKAKIKTKWSCCWDWQPIHNQCIRVSTHNTTTHILSQDVTSTSLRFMNHYSDNQWLWLLLYYSSFVTNYFRTYNSTGDVHCYNNYIIFSVHPSFICKNVNPSVAFSALISNINATVFINNIFLNAHIWYFGNN